MLNDFAVVRRKYVVKAELEHCVYQLVDLIDKKKTIKLILEFYSIEKPSVGDVLELPDSMLYFFENGMVMRNHQLYFGLPEETPTGPEGFNIQEDYAFITYTKTNDRVLMQRYYG